MIKNIIFDIGNVLLHFKPEKYLEETVKARDLAQGIYKAVFLSNEWVELDRGGITLEEAVDCICKKKSGHYCRCQAMYGGIISICSLRSLKL